MSYEPTSDDLYTKCPCCKKWQHIDDIQVGGADDGKVICDRSFQQFRPKWLDAAEFSKKVGVPSFPPGQTA
jgi:hypothetical protein